MAFLHSPQPNLGISAEPASPARTKFFLNDGSLRNLRVWMAIILGIGLAVRMTLILVNSHSAQYGGEPYNIALSLANHGTYADVFGSGSGPTAHISPALPIILALIIRVAGTGPAGHLVNSTLAAIVAAAAFALLPALAVKCRLGMLPGVTAGLVGAALPINYWAQTAGYWDAPYAMLGLTGLCVLFSGYWIEQFFPLRAGIFLGVLSGVVCLVNPTILQVLVGWCIVGMIRFKKNRIAFLRVMATVAVIIVIILSPWAFRNFKTFGGAIWTRSNFGLELQLSNRDGATANLERNVRSPDFPHPLTQRKERQKVRQMGELAYHQAKKKEALLWIRDHPARFAQLVVFRIFFFWFPPMLRWWQSIAEALMTILAIAGLLSLFNKNHPSAWMFLAILTFYPAVYLVIQVSPRYRLPIEPILLLLGCFFCLDLWNTLGRNRLKVPSEQL
jgi:hypothetical protein